MIMSSNNIQINPSKVEIMSGMKALVGKKMSKNVKFMGEDVKISKLSVAEVMDIQEKAQALNEDNASATAGFDILTTVIRSAVEGAAELTDEDFQSFPMEELSTLSNNIMSFSGMGAEQQKGK